MNEQAVYITDGKLPDEMLVELGRIVALWTAVNELLDAALERLAGMDQYMEARSGRGFRRAPFIQRLQVFSDYCGQLALEFPYLRAYRVVMEKLKAAHALHKRYVQSRILFNPETGQYEVPSSVQPDNPVSTPETVCTETLRRDALMIVEAREALYALIFRPGTSVAAPQWIGA
jgi:hypothetical protein